MKPPAPNRVAALGATATAVVAALATLLGAVDSIAKAIVVVALIVVVGLLAAVYMLGSVRHEELERTHPKPPRKAPRA